MTKPHRNALLAPTLLASVLLATSAAADPLRLGTLPEGHLPAPPPAEQTPKSIPAAERVAGFYLGDPRTQTKTAAPANGYSYLAIFDDEQSAADYAKGVAGSPYFADAALGNPRSSSCFTTATANTNAAGAIEQIWAAAQTGFHYVYFGYPGVQVLRAERWRDTPQGASLETTVMWLDQQTGGMREVSRTTIELRRLATPYKGLSVYATRAGTDAVELIVRRDPDSTTAELAPAPLEQPLDPEDAAAMQRLQLAARRNMGLQQLLHLQAQMPGQAKHSTCQHLRLQLKVRPQPPAASHEPAAPDSATITASVTLGTQHDLTKQQAMKLGLDPERRAEQVTGVRARALAIQVGISQLSRDAEPIVSLSYRWSEKAKDVPLLPQF